MFSASATWERGGYGQTVSTEAGAFHRVADDAMGRRMLSCYVGIKAFLAICGKCRFNQDNRLCICNYPVPNPEILLSIQAKNTLMGLPGFPKKDGNN